MFDADIGQTPEDFIVQEITKEGVVLEIGKYYSPEDLGISGSQGDFTTFVMEKKGWNTIQALREIAKKLGRGKKSISFAGTKDRNTISVQLASIYGKDPKDLANIHIKDIKINGAWKASAPIKMGMLLGNAFSINAYSKSDFTDKVEKIEENLGGKFPNYFGLQRFGNRGNNVKIGISLLKGDFSNAALLFLTDISNERNPAAIEARTRLRNEMNFSKALDYFPRYLKYERRVLAYLAKYNNYANALRQIQRQLLLMFIHSVESYLFNEEVKYCISVGAENFVNAICSANAYGFPDLSTVKPIEKGINLLKNDTKHFEVINIIGYDTNLNDYEKSLLDKLGLSLENFKMKHMPELNCKGSHRVAFAPYKNFSFSIKNTQINFKFSIPSG
ncbi:MAG: tRNA pseudouridine(13) synthase TruD, partial [Candidatus Micrarchaeaceae archaeon]